MFSEVMEFFGLEKELDHLGFFETTSQKHLAKELKVAITKWQASPDRTGKIDCALWCCG